MRILRKDGERLERRDLGGFFGIWVFVVAKEWKVCYHNCAKIILGVVMIYTFSINTEKENMYDITKNVQKAVDESGVKNGIAVVYTPHTTAAITINENADKYVVMDILFGLNTFLHNRPEFLHDEGNSSAHLKSSLVGCSEQAFIEDGKLVLGVWQSFFFCEFDGPRTRKYMVKVIEC